MLELSNISTCALIPLLPASLQRPSCVAEVTVRPPAAASASASSSAAAPAAAAKKSGGFDFKQYMAERAVMIDAALDRSVPLQYPEVINEAMRYSLLAGGWALALGRAEVGLYVFKIPPGGRASRQADWRAARRAPFPTRTLAHPPPPPPAPRPPACNRRQARAAGAVPGRVRDGGRHH